MNEKNDYTWVLIVGFLIFMCIFFVLNLIVLEKNKNNEIEILRHELVKAGAAEFVVEQNKVVFKMRENNE